MQMNCLIMLLLVLFPILSSAATSTWQGPYVGAYLGGGFAKTQTSTSAGTNYFSTSAEMNAIHGAGSLTNYPAGPLAGIALGHDWAGRHLLYGVVADFGAMPFSSADTLNSAFGSVYTSMRTNWLFTLRGRVGYPVQLRWPSLAYLTAGMAMTQLRVSNGFVDNTALAGRGGSDVSENQVGCTFGAGLELAAYGHATLVLEYLYVLIPTVKVSSTIANSVDGFGVPAGSLNSPFTTTGQFHAGLLKLGLNYRIDE